MSSAYNNIEQLNPFMSIPQLRSLIPVARSFKYIENRIGLIMSPCLTPDVTLKDGIEKTLVEQIPEVKAVKDLTDHSIDDNAYYK